MQSEQLYITEHPDNFKLKALHWANSFSSACYFDSNGFSDPYSAFDVLIAADVKEELQSESGNAFSQLQLFLDKHQGAFIPGYFSYDLKNETEQLQSNNPDHLQFPQLYFFVPQNLILVKGNAVTITAFNPAVVWDSINQLLLPHNNQVGFKGTISSRFSKDEYTAVVKKFQQHIQRGDIYEVNFCQEFFAENTFIDPVEAFKELNRISPTPFSNFFKIHDRYIISATPERFLSRRGSKLISQPIKGTAKRSLDNVVEDENAKLNLRKNEKELSENVMIVDLVRNDLTKSAKLGTVKVEELFEIYSFKQVHQMISTVVCEADETLSNPQIISNTFPMGSMTGAPKIRAMKLIEQYERNSRGVYSGAAGYFSSTGDFDFNVVIRTLLYNAKTKYLSFQVGSAITFDADAEHEYEECLLKAEAINEVLSH